MVTSEQDGAETISARLATIHARLPAGVTLLAVSKAQPLEALQRAYGAGQDCFAESRLQEALPKIAAMGRERISWHFIGRLQSNKVRPVVKAFDWIHSIDSAALLERISRIAAEEGRCPEVLLQVKLRKDPAKGGFAPDLLHAGLSAWARLPHLHLRGLMTMAPQGLTAQQRQALFGDCATLARALRQLLPATEASRFDQLSMGMSGDWPDAVRAGSTVIRIGTGIFGRRPLISCT